MKYLFQNSWYDSYVVSKEMSFKIKASQNFSNQLYVVFFSSIWSTSPKFWRIILINLPCPLSMYVFCFRVPFETKHILFTTFKNQSTTTLLKHINETIENRYTWNQKESEKKGKMPQYVRIIWSTGDNPNPTCDRHLRSEFSWSCFGTCDQCFL